MLKKKISILLFYTLFFSITLHGQNLPALKISANHRFFTAVNKPFFWLGDTGWLLFSKLKREDAEKYLETRHKQGFNVIQVMVLHSTAENSAYGDSALLNKDVTKPNVSSSSDQGNYWNNIDWVINRAADKGIYVVLVPVWGSVVKAAHINQAQAKAYASFLANRYKSHSNIIWMNGGDIQGTDSLKVWNMIGRTIHELDPDHLITYHPRGRTQSSTWFHNEDWLSFNSIQSGHRTYKQDTSKKDLRYGEDNWRYIEADYNRQPAKPTLDAEPSYEKIPYGLHDITLPRWTDADVRRYGYWSVFAGACGYTYGNNDVMQMHRPSDKSVAYGSKDYWFKSINDPGAKQMIYLKKLMLSRPYFERVPDQAIISKNQGVKYNRLIATRGKNYAMIYNYTGRDMVINSSGLPGQKVKALWYNPRNGKTTSIGYFAKSRAMKFNPPSQPANGNDWVLILDAI